MKLHRLFILLLAAAAAAGALQARQARGEGRTVRLLSLLEAAERGEPKALYTLASVLEEGGEGLEADPAEARRLYLAAADSLYAPALNYIGYSYMKGTQLFRAEPDSALFWLERAAQLGEPAAWNNLGWILLNPPPGKERNEEKALSYLQKAADAGNAPAMTTLASLAAEKGLRLRAIELCDNALRRGFMPASQQYAALMADSLSRMSPRELLSTARRFYTSSGTPRFSLALLQRYLEPQADSALVGMHPGASTPETDSAALAEGLAILALGHSRGLLPYDYRRANALFYRAALLGNPAACFILGETLGLQPDAAGVPSDCEVGDYWLSLAERAGVSSGAQAIELLSPTKEIDY